MERKQRGSPSEAVSGQKVCRNYATVFRGPLSHVCGPALHAPCRHLYVCGCGSRDARSLWHALALLSWIIPGASEAGLYLYGSHRQVVSGGGIGVPSRAVRKVASWGYRGRRSDKRCGAGMPIPEGYFPKYVLWLIAEGLYRPARK